jgi:hypothetical protein
VPIIVVVSLLNLVAHKGSNQLVNRPNNNYNSSNRPVTH